MTRLERVARLKPTAVAAVAACRRRQRGERDERKKACREVGAYANERVQTCVRNYNRRAAR